MGPMRRLVPVLCAALVAASCGGEPSSPPDRAEGPDRGVTTSILDVDGGKDPASTALSTTPPATTAPTTSVAARATVDACPAVPPRSAPDPERPVYDVAMSADPASGVVEGAQTVRFVPDLAVDTLVFRLWANGPRPASVGTSITVGPVTERIGSTDPVERVTRLDDPTTLVVELGRSVPPGTAVMVSVPWRLEVGGTVNDRISRQAGSLRLGSFVPLLAWEPGVGWARQPPTSGFAEATSSPTADWTLAIDVPEGNAVIASGVEVGPGRWEADGARDVAVSVGRFSVVSATAMAPHPVEVSVAVHDGVDDASAYLGRLVAALEAFAAWYGPYPWPVYRLSITPELSGGIEFPMHVLQGPGTSGRTTPHEVAHMWFYGLVGNDQGRDPWLDEGLATYAEARFEGTLGGLGDRSIPADGIGRAGEPMTYWESRSSSYYRSVYVQPAAALARIGDPGLIDCALAHYVASHAHTIAAPDDLWRSLDATFVDWATAMAPAGLVPG